MFGKSKELDTHDTIIGESTRITGNLSFRGTLRVDGIIEGDVSVMTGTDSKNHLSIGAKGSIKGKIAADNITLAGTVIGDIHAKLQLELQSTATIEGDVYYKELAMDMGTQFSGKLEPLYAKNTDAMLNAKLDSGQNAGSQEASDSSSQGGTKANTLLSDLNDKTDNNSSKASGKKTVIKTS